MGNEDTLRKGSTEEIIPDPKVWPDISLYEKFIAELAVWVENAKLKAMEQDPEQFDTTLEPIINEARERTLKHAQTSGACGEGYFQKLIEIIHFQHRENHEAYPESVTNEVVHATENVAPVIDPKEHVAGEEEAVAPLPDDGAVSQPQGFLPSDSYLTERQKRLMNKGTAREEGVGTIVSNEVSPLHAATTREAPPAIEAVMENGEPLSYEKVTETVTLASLGAYLLSGEVAIGDIATEDLEALKEVANEKVTSLVVTELIRRLIPEGDVSSEQSSSTPTVDDGSIEHRVKKSIDQGTLDITLMPEAQLNALLVHPDAGVRQLAQREVDYRAHAGSRIRRIFKDGKVMPQVQIAVKTSTQDANQKGTTPPPVSLNDASLLSATGGSAEAPLATHTDDTVPPVVEQPLDVSPAESTALPPLAEVVKEAIAQAAPPVFPVKETSPIDPVSVEPITSAQEEIVAVPKNNEKEIPTEPSIHQKLNNEPSYRGSDVYARALDEQTKDIVAPKFTLAPLTPEVAEDDASLSKNDAYARAFHEQTKDIVAPNFILDPLDSEVSAKDTLNSNQVTHPVLTTETLPSFEKGWVEMSDDEQKGLTEKCRHIFQVGSMYHIANGAGVVEDWKLNLVTDKGVALFEPAKENSIQEVQYVPLNELLKLNPIPEDFYAPLNGFEIGAPVLVNERGDGWKLVGVNSDSGDIALTRHNAEGAVTDYTEVALYEFLNDNFSYGDLDPFASEMQEEWTNEQTIAARNIVAEQFKNTFNIEERELMAIPEFSALSEGQQLLVHNELNNYAVSQVKTDALKAFREKNESLQASLFKWEEGLAQNKDMFFGLARIASLGAKFLHKETWQKMGMSIFKRKIIAEKEKELAEQITEGDIDQKEYIRALSIQAKEGPDVLIDKETGKIDLVFLKSTDFGENLSQIEQEKIHAFNTIASEFSNVPHTWQERGATEKERSAYREKELAYQFVRDRVLDMLKERGDDESALLDVNELERKITFTQFFNAHPKAAEQLASIKDQNIWKSAVVDIAETRGASFALGATIRTVAATCGALIAAPLAGASVGALSGYKRAKTELNEREMLAKAGVTDKNKEAVNIVDAVVEEEDPKTGELRLRGLAGKLDDISTEIEALPTGMSPIAKKETLIRLQARIAYTELKLNDGLVNYGEKAEHIKNKYTLLRSLARAKALAMTEEIDETPLATGINSASTWQKGRRSVSERLDDILKIREQKISEAQKSYVHKTTLQAAKYGAAFAFGGALVADIAHGSDGVLGRAIGTASDETKVIAHTSTGEASVPPQETTSGANQPPLENNAVVPATPASEVSPVSGVVEERRIPVTTGDDVVSPTLRTPADSVPHEEIVREVMPRSSAELIAQHYLVADTLDPVTGRSTPFWVEMKNYNAQQMMTLKQEDVAPEMWTKMSVMRNYAHNQGFTPGEHIVPGEKESIDAFFRRAHIEHVMHNGPRFSKMNQLLTLEEPVQPRPTAIPQQVPLGDPRVVSPAQLSRPMNNGTPHVVPPLQTQGVYTPRVLPPPQVGDVVPEAPPAPVYRTLPPNPNMSPQ